MLAIQTGEGKQVAGRVLEIPFNELPLSFSFLIPWAVCLKESWYAERTIIDGKRLCFDGTGLQLFGNYIKWFLLTIITFGIYSFWLHIKLKQWVVKHTHFDKE